MIFKRKMKMMLLMFVLIFAVVGCSNPVVTPEDSTDELDEGLEVYISIKGVQQEPISITIEEIKNFEVISREVTSVNSAGEEDTFEATGALLENLLMEFDVPQKDLAGVRFAAGDGYSIEVPREILQNRHILLCYEVDGAPLEPNIKPIRVIIPDERAMYWVSNLETIEIIESAVESEIHKVLFLETMKESLELEEVEYYDAIDQAAKTEDLLMAAGEEELSEIVYIQAVDGLEKNETLSIFLDGYIKLTGLETPAFFALDMPKGMYVKELLYFSNGSTAWLSYEKALDKIGTSAVGEKNGLDLETVLKEIGFIDGTVYIFTAADGYSVEINGSDLANGVLYQDEEGRLSTYFDGLPKNTSIKDLLSIEVKE